MESFLGSQRQPAYQAIPESDESSRLTLSNSPLHAPVSITMGERVEAGWNGHPDTGGSMRRSDIELTEASPTPSRQASRVSPMYNGIDSAGAKSNQGVSSNSGSKWLSTLLVLVICAMAALVGYMYNCTLQLTTQLQALQLTLDTYQQRTHDRLVSLDQDLHAVDVNTTLAVQHTWEQLHREVCTPHT